MSKFYITTPSCAGTKLFYCGVASHDYLGSVPFIRYANLAHTYDTQSEAEAALKFLPLAYHGSKHVQIEESV